ncbi:MAG: VCBS repeat-containing protein [Planctomycetales bacterium]|nr:VCBS repeat-containing protein [Planctomycetales bacterium]
MGTQNSRRRRTGKQLAVEHLEGRRLLAVTGEFTHLIDSTEIGRASLASGDVDGDGDLDLLLADGLAGWKENLGDGTFAFRSNIGTESDFADAVYAADIDNDGDLDVVTLHNVDLGHSRDARPWRPNIGWHENVDGQGGFSPKREIVRIGSNVNRLDVVDIDSDGYVDIVYGTPSGGAEFPQWIENNRGQLAPAGRLIESSAEFGYEFGDIDGDARIDLLVRDQQSGPYNWLRNTADGFQFQKQIKLVDSPRSFFDYDNDGDVDLGSSLGIFVNDGDGDFSPVEGTRVGFDARSFDFVDVDSDGDLDVIYIGRPTTREGFDSGILWNVDGNYDDNVLTHEIALSATFGEFTGDSTLDFIQQRHYRALSDIQLFDGFAESRLVTDQAGMGDAVALRDMDLDGDLDLLVSSIHNVDRNYNMPLSLQWYENLGGLKFSARKPIEQQSSYIESVYEGHSRLKGDAGDLDGNGSMDVVSLFESQLSIRYDYVENPEVDIVLDVGGFSIGDLRIHDVDGDSDLDILFGKAVTLLNDGTGRNFTFHSQSLGLSESCSAFDWRFKDIDGDADFDVVGRNGNGFNLIENIDGVFQACEPLDDYTREQFLSEFADLDGDGDLDRIELRGGINDTLTTSDVLLHETRLIGDVNDDGRFDSTDLMMVFAAGEYEDGIARNSTFIEGDWNGDGEFDTSDIVAAFQAGNFVG